MKDYFVQRSMREQLLLAFFAVAAGLTWLVAAAGHLRTQHQDLQQARADLASQQLWLDRQGEIETRATAAIKSLDPAKTFDATRLASEISTMARDAGLAINTEPPHTTQTPQLAIHSVQVTSRRAALSALLKFYESLNQRAPYLGLEKCSLLVEKNAGGLLTANLQVSSVEVIRTAPAAK